MWSLEVIISRNQRLAEELSVPSCHATAKTGLEKTIAQTKFQQGLAEDAIALLRLADDGCPLASE